MLLARYSFLLLLLLCGGCSKEEPRTRMDVPVSVTVERVKKLNVPIYLETIGNVESPCIVDIRPQVSGTLLHAHVEPGQIVKKGDLLFTIDPRSYQAILDKAEANLMKNKAAYEFAKSRVERYSQMVKKEFISKLNFDEYQREMDVAKAQVLNDEAEVALAKIDLEHCHLCAPIDGRISNIRVDPGNLVTAHHKVPLTQLRQISPLCINFTVAQCELQHMQRTKCRHDLKIEVILPHEKGDVDDAYIGHLIFIDNHVDSQTGTILLKGIVDNEEHLLWPGEFVHIRMCLRYMGDALIVPESAIQNGQQGSFLFVINGEGAEMRPVVLGEKVKDTYIVEKGVDEGEQVVTAGQLNLSPGKKVIIR